jgi:hypothetical protein
LFDNNSKFGTLVQITHPIELSPEKSIIQCGKTVAMLSIKRETIMNLPKVIEPLEVLDSPGTPSTTNEQDVEGKSETESTKKKRVKTRKAERKEITIDEQSQDLLNENLVETKIMNGSKKIFKIIKNNGAASNPEKISKKKGKK